MKKLDGKTAIVTGASRGIGKAIAKDFAAWGAKVVCAARTVTEGDHFLEGSLRSTVAEIREAGRFEGTLVTYVVRSVPGRSRGWRRYTICRKRAPACRGKYRVGRRSVPATP